MTDVEEPTGERLIPSASAGELVHAEHLARYRLATRLAGGRRVLDAACGEGYGSAMLAAAGAEHVTGIDVDEATVERARRRYGLDFRVGDVAALPFEDATFDLVVSFETIEHVPEPERALDEFARVLTDAGVLLISTPNAAEYLDDNPFHFREYDSEEFTQALAARFPHIARLHQQNFLTSAILDDGRLAQEDGQNSLGLDVAKAARVERGRELYFIALCGRRPLPALEGDVAVLADIYEAHRLASELRAWPERAAEAERQVGEWSKRAYEAERIQREWEARALQAERRMEELQASLSWRLIQPLRRVSAAVRRRG